MSSDDEPVIFGSTMEALRRALGPDFTPALAAELKTAGIDAERVQAGYRMDTWVNGLRIVARHLSPSLPERAQFAALGRRFMRGYVSTPIGTAALALGKVIGVKRTLLRMGRNFKQAANYLECEAKDVGPREVHLRTFTAPRYLGRTSDRTTLITDYRRGVLEEVLTLLGASGTVEALEVRLAEQDVTFRVTWA